jgi:hypothetical protein
MTAYEALRDEVLRLQALRGPAGAVHGTRAYCVVTEAERRARERLAALPEQQAQVREWAGRVAAKSGRRAGGWPAGLRLIFTSRDPSGGGGAA